MQLVEPLFQTQKTPNLWTREPLVNLTRAAIPDMLVGMLSQTGFDRDTVMSSTEICGGNVSSIDFSASQTKNNGPF